MDNPYLPSSSNPGGSESFGSSGGISPRTADIMARTKGWVRFIAVVLFVNFGISVIRVFIMFGSSSTSGGDAYRIGQIAGLALVLLLYLYPAVKLNGYASRIGVLLQSVRPGDLESALDEHRAFWRYIGIIAIVLLSVMVIAIFIGIAAAVSR